MRIIVLIRLWAVLTLFVLPTETWAGDNVVREKLVDGIHRLFDTYETREEIFEAAKNLFWSLAAMSLVWTMGMQIARQDIGEMLMELTRFTIVTGIFYWLLASASGSTGSDGIVANIFNSFFQLLGGIPDDESFIGIGDDIGRNGVQLYLEVIYGTQNVGDGLMIVTNLMSIGTLVVLSLMAAQFLILLIAAWMMGYAGIFLLGFGGAKWTSPIAVNYYKHVLAIGLCMLALGIIGGQGRNVIQHLISEAIQSRAGVVNLLELGLILPVSILFFVLSLRVPQMLYAVVTGSQLGLYAGTASMIGSAIGTGSAAAMASISGWNNAWGQSSSRSDNESRFSVRTDSVMEAAQRSAISMSTVPEPFQTQPLAPPDASRYSALDGTSGGANLYAQTSSPTLSPTAAIDAVSGYHAVGHAPVPASKALSAVTSHKDSAENHSWPDYEAEMSAIAASRGAVAFPGPSPSPEEHVLTADRMDSTVTSDTSIHLATDHGARVDAIARSNGGSVDESAGRLTQHPDVSLPASAYVDGEHLAGHSEPATSATDASAQYRSRSTVSHDAGFSPVLGMDTPHDTQAWSSVGTGSAPNIVSEPGDLLVEPPSSPQPSMQHVGRLAVRDEGQFGQVPATSAGKDAVGHVAAIEGQGALVDTRPSMQAGIPDIMASAAPAMPGISSVSRAMPGDSRPLAGVQDATGVENGFSSQVDAESSYGILTDKAAPAPPADFAMTSSGSAIDTNLDETSIRQSAERGIDANVETSTAAWSEHERTAPGVAHPGVAFATDAHPVSDIPLIPAGGDVDLTDRVPVPMSNPTSPHHSRLATDPGTDATEILVEKPMASAVKERVAHQNAPPSLTISTSATVDLTGDTSRGAQAVPNGSGTTIDASMERRLRGSESDAQVTLDVERASQSAGGADVPVHAPVPLMASHLDRSDNTAVLSDLSRNTAGLEEGCGENLAPVVIRDEHGDVSTEDSSPNLASPFRDEIIVRPDDRRASMVTVQDLSVSRETIPEAGADAITGRESDIAPSAWAEKHEAIATPEAVRDINAPSREVVTVTEVASHAEDGAPRERTSQVIESLRKNDERHRDEAPDRVVLHDGQSQRSSITGSRDVLAAAPVPDQATALGVPHAYDSVAVESEFITSTERRPSMLEEGLQRDSPLTVIADEERQVSETVFDPAQDGTLSSLEHPEADADLSRAVDGMTSMDAFATAPERIRASEQNETDAQGHSANQTGSDAPADRATGVSKPDDESPT